MDKNSIIGLVLIGLLFLGYFYFTKPSKEQIEAAKRSQDSIENIKKTYNDSLIAIEELKSEYNQQNIENDNIVNSLTDYQKDSINDINLSYKYGMFRNGANGEEKLVTIENEKMIIKLSNKGGKIYSVQLKDYVTWDTMPLILFENREYSGFDKNASSFGLEMIADGKTIITNDMYFSPTIDTDIIKVTDKPLEISMRLYSTDQNKYIEYQYTIQPDDYMIDFNVNFVGLNMELSTNPYVTLRWNSLIPALEKGRDWESNNTTIYYRLSDDEIDRLNETKDNDNFDSRANVKWVAYKQQFFSSILIAKDKLERPYITLEKLKPNNANILKSFQSEFTFPLEHKESETYAFNFYFGPNRFSQLKSYNEKLEKVVPLGWGIFGWVNRFLVIPIFNWLGKFIANYGIIILFLTIIIKVILFPFTYKSYMSSAKMRILKPQVDALNEKYPKGKEMEKQQAVMNLYKRAGASPMGGCLPMLIQFPILIAMFRFFPASIELRQESFLWAKDLSSYDSILDLPFIIPLYGNHISLFTLLMAATMVISTRLTSASQPSSSNMPGMKMMMYIMPLFMVLWFNNYSSGLSYYYLLANLITIIQTWVMQKFIVKEDKVLAQMEANKKKVKSKSKWQQRIEEVQRQQKQIQNRKK
jgi:YidC/Oxa1 family membrane protein insertase